MNVTVLNIVRYYFWSAAYEASPRPIPPGQQMAYGRSVSEEQGRRVRQREKRAIENRPDAHRSSAGNVAQFHRPRNSFSPLRVFSFATTVLTAVLTLSAFLATRTS